MLHQVQMAFGIFFPSMIGLSFPHYTYQVKASDITWRITFLAPVAVALIQMILFSLFYRLDTPPRYIQKGKVLNAFFALRYLYTEKGAEARL